LGCSSPPCSTVQSGPIKRTSVQLELIRTGAAGAANAVAVHTPPAWRDHMDATDLAALAAQQQASPSAVATPTTLPRRISAKPVSAIVVMTTPPLRGTRPSSPTRSQAATPTSGPPECVITVPLTCHYQGPLRYLTVTHAQLSGQFSVARTGEYVALQAGGQGWRVSLAPLGKPVRDLHTIGRSLTAALCRAGSVWWTSGLAASPARRSPSTPDGPRSDDEARGRHDGAAPGFPK
jgi:hypothetical protein